ncbi:MAG: FeoA family protein [Candidatus Kaelpia aquatica]|nr:FeoA family protein [Candidatus Kaelpia aquatica]
MIVDITHLKPKESGVVVEIKGGTGLIDRLKSMGIRVSKRVSKVSSHFWRGPQTIEIDNFTVAIGHGMAKKIIVDTDK